jgi:protein tyrosine phosphatase
MDKIIESLFTEINEIYTCENGGKLFLGNQSSCGNFPDHWNYNDDDYNQVKNKLKKLNIEHIICCADNMCKFPNDFQYKQLLIYDNPTYDISIHFDDIHQYISKNLAKNKNILLHCNAGVSRSPTILISFLIKSKIMTLDDAIIFVKNKRPCINVDNFYKYLQKI